MTAEDFDTLILNRRLELTRMVLARKAGEYATTIDRLHNFKRAAAMTGQTPLKACVGMMVKHLVSVFDLVDAAAMPSTSVLDEKIGDSVNYLILLEALFVDRQQEVLKRTEGVKP